MSRSEPVVKIRLSFCTWAPKTNHELLEDRLSELMQAIESWGYCQVSQLAGDPLDCVMSSALGISCASTAPPGILPLYEVMKLVPWQRASSPFARRLHPVQDDRWPRMAVPDGNQRHDHLVRSCAWPSPAAVNPS